ncbi:MAG: hypothetical protein Q9195_005914 [Heterodermia aff. obscurata]
MPIRPAPYSDSRGRDRDSNHALYKDTEYPSSPTSQDKLQSYRAQPIQDHLYNPSQRPPGTSSDATTHTAPTNMNMAPAPDTLTKAFNEAIKPYLEQIELLRNELEDTTIQVQQLEDERADMHAWIDKRGLRADVPPRIASAMNSDPSAASTLNYHIDRKMTVINGDLHRLQDSLTAHLPTSTFATTLLTLLPSIENLASLPGGASLAFELVIKLGGNLNSHGGDDGWNNDADIQSRASFYSRLDDCMVDVIRQRLSQAGGEDPPWVVARDVKRLEKTGSFLRSKIGLQSYFPRSLDVMRYEAKRGDSQQL